MTYDWNKMVEITVPVGINGWVYAGSVTINGVTVDFPIGIPTSVPEPVAELLKKFIALEEDKNKVPAQGAGGVGGFIVTATVTSTDEEGKSGACIFDKTFAETLAAVTAGRYVTCHFAYDGVTNIMQVVMVGELSEVVFALPVYSRFIVMAMLPDGTGTFQITTV